METTFNNIFKSALNTEIEKKARDEREKAQQVGRFLSDMAVIKKNLESAFIGTPIRVEMGMFGVNNPVYTTIHIRWDKDSVGSICANSCPYHCTNWDTKMEEKDLRLNGVPYTYDELIKWVATKYSRTL